MQPSVQTPAEPSMSGASHTRCDARSPGAVVPTAPGDHIPPRDPQTSRRLLSVAHNHGKPTAKHTSGCVCAATQKRCFNAAQWTEGE